MDAAARMLMAGLATAGALLPPAEAQPQQIRREAQDEAGTRAVIETLSARLLAAPSATAVLEAWCAERGLAADPRLVAVRVPGIDKAPSPIQRERLAVGPEEPVRYRRVRLTCGAHVLSEADNWYVPGRLTAEMNAALDGTQVPFGAVVRPLKPSRRNLSLRMLWRPEDGTVPVPDMPLFAVEAVLSTGGVPFCEVAETYTGAVLSRGER